ncbi:TetR/AcrR family transcriptional regulator [Achromobacter sp. GG226]|uniref:TetR/AcrR family transcriptional regulator n=1 Tax=Verticiella alkaliphila TaxID=2779529 RepID=UPI001C0CA60E|nr:TetR/AcrR family transcriptional regulator [Verticiella sp. GG226]MBU4612458.1 TetR/AcrR family transcriptional regulator [Verticiella sp. GG226]
MPPVSSPSAPAGLRPAQQQRSQATLARILRAARQRISRAELDAVSVNEIVKAAGCSVGAFYTRFENKEALFRALVADMLAGGRRHLDAMYADTPDADLLDTVVHQALLRTRRHAGILRSAIKLGLTDPSVWEPIRAYGQENATRLCKRLARHGPVDETRVRFAFQVLHGSVLNTLLHDPGPLRLDSPAFAQELTRVFRLAVAAD